MCLGHLTFFLSHVLPIASCLATQQLGFKNTQGEPFSFYPIVKGPKVGFWFSPVLPGIQGRARSYKIPHVSLIPGPTGPRDCSWEGQVPSRLLCQPCRAQTGQAGWVLSIPACRLTCMCVCLCTCMLCPYSQATGWGSCYGDAAPEERRGRRCR